MKSIAVLALALLCAYAHAKSYPVLHCVNDQATSADCKADVKAVVQAVSFWFEPYVTSYNSLRSGSGRRQLLDCTRFCEPSITHFVVHAPCDCTKWGVRHLQSTDSHTSVGHVSRHAQSDLSALEGPIQIFETYTKSIVDPKCKEIFQGSKCNMNFVGEYSNEFRVAADAEVDEDVAEDGMSQEEQNSLVLHEDPVTGEVMGAPIDENEEYANASGAHADPDTGNAVNPSIGEEDEDEEYANGSGAHADPDTGSAFNPSIGEDEEEEGDSEGAHDNFRNPVTGKVVDPETGEDVEDAPDQKYGDEEFDGPP